MSTEPTPSRQAAGSLMGTFWHAFERWAFGQRRAAVLVCTARFQVARAGYRAPKECLSRNERRRSMRTGHTWQLDIN